MNCILCAIHSLERSNQQKQNQHEVDKWSAIFILWSDPISKHKTNRKWTSGVLVPEFDRLAVVLAEVFEQRLSIGALGTRAASGGGLELRDERRLRRGRGGRAGMQRGGGELLDGDGARAGPRGGHAARRHRH